MQKVEIDKIYDIFLRRTGVDFRRKENLRDKKIFGAEVNIEARELVQVYMDLKYELGIKFREEDLIDKKFATFNQIVELVKETCGYSVDKKEEKLCQN